MSIYLHKVSTATRSHQDLTKSHSNLSLCQENTNESTESLHKSRDRSMPTTAPLPTHLRVRNANIPARPPSTDDIDRQSIHRSRSRNPSECKRQLSLRSISSLNSNASEAARRLPLPPSDDFIITKAVESSLKQAKSASLLSHKSRDSESKANLPFRRWIKTLNRNTRGRKAVKPRVERWSLNEFENDPVSVEIPETLPVSNRHRKSISWASGSSAFVTAYRSARQSFSTLSDTSIRRNLGTRGSMHGSHQSYSVDRSSVEDAMHLEPFLDEASWGRSVKRSQILEELVDSEESYLSDLKALLNVYSTLQASMPELSKNIILQIQRNVNEIFVLHEELLENLHPLLLSIRVIGRKPKLKSSFQRKHRGTRSSYSMEAHIGQETVCFVSPRDSLELARRRSKRPKAIAAGPSEAAYAAAVFEDFMGRFFIYQEYGATYETMLQDISLAAKSITNWNSYQRGYEALANLVAPEKTRLLGSKKGLTFEDLMIKPIQRICKYPLLFADLCKQTPVTDGPESHMKIEKALFRLRETAAEINSATNNKLAKEAILRSWKLQDILVFQDPITAPYMFRSLGRATLCGVLHIAYQSRRTAVGRYMLCALYTDYLVLACPIQTGEDQNNFQVVASICLAGISLEEVDNGKGLQCYTAPYSWKLLFESDQELYELILSACNQKEEEQWKTHLLNSSEFQSQHATDETSRFQGQLSILSLDIKPLSKLLGQPGTLVRRVSVQRAATIGGRQNACQVIIRNTYSLRDGGKASCVDEAGALGRSHSVLSTNSRVPILAPRRAERVQIEHDMLDVWTQELLPYPGMEFQHLDDHIRASASSVLRKLSRSSLAASLRKWPSSQLSGEKHRGLRETFEGEEMLGTVFPGHSLMPVIESPIGSIRAKGSFRLDDNAVYQPLENPPRSSLSTMSRIKRRVSEAGFVPASKNDRVDAEESQPLKARWSIPRLPSALSLHNPQRFRRSVPL